MKVTAYDGSEVRRVLCAMATDPVVCARVATQWRDEGLFDAPWANMVGYWCVKNMRDHGAPPNGNIQVIFEQWAAKRGKLDDKLVAGVEKFLTILSDEHEQNGNGYSSAHILDMAGKVFDKARLKKMTEAIENCLDIEDVDEAWRILETRQRVKLGENNVIKLPLDFEFAREVLENRERSRPVIEFPGDLGHLFGDSFTRGALISFMAPDKVGKSFWLVELGFRALKGGYNVVHFECGDLSEDEVAERYYSRAARRPIKACCVKFPMSVDGRGGVVTEERNYEDLTAQIGYNALNRAARNEDALRVEVHGNSTLSAAGIDARLTDMEREGWPPGVVIVDYADILAAPTGFRDTLDQIDETWKTLKRIAHKHHCLVLTASQTNAAAYDTRGLLRKRHFSGRKTKLAVVDGMIGINVSDEDKTKGLYRINWIVRRRGHYNESNFVYVAGSLPLSCTIIRTCWGVKN